MRVIFSSLFLYIHQGCEHLKVSYNSKVEINTDYSMNNICLTIAYQALNYILLSKHYLDSTTRYKRFFKVRIS